jgi:hypothetical protein
MSKPITLIRQQHSDGCGAACLAMLLDISYEDARNILPGYTSYEDMSRAVDLYLPLTNLNYSLFALLLVGDEKRQHWILAYNKKIYDPAYSRPTNQMNRKYADVIRTIGSGWR